MSGFVNYTCPVCGLLWGQTQQLRWIDYNAEGEIVSLTIPPDYKQWCHDCRAAKALCETLVERLSDDVNQRNLIRAIIEAKRAIDKECL